MKFFLYHHKEKVAMQVQKQKGFYYGKKIMWNILTRMYIHTYIQLFAYQIIYMKTILVNFPLQLAIALSCYKQSLVKKESKIGHKG